MNYENKLSWAIYIKQWQSRKNAYQCRGRLMHSDGLQHLRARWAKINLQNTSYIINFYIYSKTCLNRTLNKIESCIHRTLNKIESCMHRTLNKIESCINRTLNQVPNVGNLYKFNMYEPNMSVFRTQKRVPKRFHLNRYHCTTRNSFIYVIMSEQSTF